MSGCTVVRPSTMPKTRHAQRSHTASGPRLPSSSTERGSRRGPMRRAHPRIRQRRGRPTVRWLARAARRCAARLGFPLRVTGVGIVSIGELWPVAGVGRGHSVPVSLGAFPRESSACPVGSPAVLLVGLTGGIGAGKSTVAAMLADRGAVVLDADQVARDVVEPDQPAFAALVKEFGPEIVGADGRLDRAALAAKAFSTPEGKAALDAITHPAIHEEFGKRMLAAPADAIVVLDVPLLVESKTAAERGYEVVIVVEAPEDIRLDRLVGRGLDRADAAARMKAQATDEERRAVATHLIDNGADPEALVAQVDALWSDLTARHETKSDPEPKPDPNPA